MTIRKLYYGDCLEVLQCRDIADQSVDLIYLDPPFNSRVNYTILFGKGKDRSQVAAFRDLWTWEHKSQAAYESLITQQGRIADAVEGLRKILGESGMLSYLLHMAERLVELRRVLKDRGSIYLHCDPTASHYLKVVMDAVFGAKNFVNEIVWCYTSGGTSKNWFSKKHDTILSYQKSKKGHFNVQKVKSYMSYSGEREYKTGNSKVTLYKDKIGIYTLINEKDWWTDIGMLSTVAKERRGYPTQKPLALLERILKASSHQGGVVLDPYCGCGTTLDAAESLGRQWIGIDRSYLSVAVIRARMVERYGDTISEHMTLCGVPTDIKSARELAFRTISVENKKTGRFEFQRWVCSLISAYPNDRAIDDQGPNGILLWQIAANEFVKGAVRVKVGKVVPNDIRALSSLVKEDYVMGIVISLYKEDTTTYRVMQQQKDMWVNPWNQQAYPRLQLWSVEEYFAGRQPQMPNAMSPYTSAVRHYLNTQISLF